MSCTFEEGEGGINLITGKVFLRDFDSNGNLKAEYYAPDYDVYIIYGENTVYDDAFSTHHDGTYIFKNLHEGKYTIFAYSTCASCSSKVEPIFKTVEINSDQNTYELSDIVVED